MIILMKGAVAGPEYVLAVDEVYDVPKRVGELLLNGPGGIFSQQSENSRNVFKRAAVIYDECIHGKKKINRGPAKPDLDDKGNVVIDEEEPFEELV